MLLPLPVVYTTARADLMLKLDTNQTHLFIRMHRQPVHRRFSVTLCNCLFVKQHSIVSTAISECLQVVGGGWIRLATADDESVAQPKAAQVSMFGLSIALADSLEQLGSALEEADLEAAPLFAHSTGVSERECCRGDVSGSASEAVLVGQYHRELVSETATEAVSETVSEGRRGLQKQCHRDSVGNSVTEAVSLRAPAQEMVIREFF